jgi:hypothetical protein
MIPRCGGLSRAGTIMKSKRRAALAGVLLTAFGCALFPVGSASVAQALEFFGASGPDSAAITPSLNLFRLDPPDADNLECNA